MPYDIFLSHASEDKDDVVRPLAEQLRALGLTVWLDEGELALGDSLRRSIDKGLSQSKYGVVVLSPAFLSKEWPQRELDALAAREDTHVKVLLPVWHRLDKSEVTRYSPLLADRLAVSTSMGLPYVADQILRAVRRGNVADAPGVRDQAVREQRNLAQAARDLVASKSTGLLVAAIVLLLVLALAIAAVSRWRPQDRQARDPGTQAPATGERSGASGGGQAGLPRRPDETGGVDAVRPLEKKGPPIKTPRPVDEPFVGTVAYNGDVTSIAFSPRGEWMATGGGNNHVALLWNARTGEQVRPFVGNSVVSSVAFSRDGKQLATDSNLFDIDTGERIAKLSGGYDVAFSPDGRFVATASGYQPFLGTRLFDPSTGSLVKHISDEYAPSLAFSQDGKLLATATGYLAKGVRLWSLDSYELVRTLEGPFTHVAFSPDGRYVAAAGKGTVRLFRSSTGEHLRDISGDIVAFSPDGRVLATVGEDKRVRFYNPSNGNPIRTLDNVFAVKLAFSADGERLGTITPDKRVQISKIR